MYVNVLFFYQSFIDAKNHWSTTSHWQTFALKKLALKFKLNWIYRTWDNYRNQKHNQIYYHYFLKLKLCQIISSLIMENNENSKLVDKYIITAKITHGDIQKMAGMNKWRNGKICTSTDLWAVVQQHFIKLVYRLTWWGNHFHSDWCSNPISNLSFQGVLL